MCAEVGDFRISRGPSTVPLMRILRNMVFFKSQNPHKAGNLCTLNRLYLPSQSVPLILGTLIHPSMGIEGDPCPLGTHTLATDELLCDKAHCLDLDLNDQMMGTSYDNRFIFKRNKLKLK